MRTSLEITGRPGWPPRTFQVQKRRKPFRCQTITVSGLTSRIAERQSSQTPHSHAQRSRSNVVNFGFFTERCKTPSWCRSARFSNWRAAPVLKMDDRAANSVTSTSNAAERNQWKIRKLYVLRSFGIYGRHRSYYAQTVKPRASCRSYQNANFRPTCAFLAPRAAVYCPKRAFVWAPASKRAAVSTVLNWVSGWDRRPRG